MIPMIPSIPGFPERSLHMGHEWGMPWMPAMGYYEQYFMGLYIHFQKKTPITITHFPSLFPSLSSIVLLGGWVEPSRDGKHSIFPPDSNQMVNPSINPVSPHLYRYSNSNQKKSRPHLDLKVSAGVHLNSLR